MEPTSWLTHDEHRLWRSYLDATRMLIQDLDKQLVRDSGISFADYEILVLLSEAEDRRLRMRELSDASTTTRSGITRAITRMEAAVGATRRMRIRQARCLGRIDRQGRRDTRRRGPGHVAAVRATMFDVLSPDDITVMADAFTTMRDHMQERRSTT